MFAQTAMMAFVAATSLADARRFYGEVLGLRLVSEDEYGLMFEGGGTQLRVALVQDLTPAGYTVLGWSVGDVSQAVRELSKRGVATERFGFMEQDADGVWTAPGGAKIAWFKDPFGNTLSVGQLTA